MLRARLLRSAQATAPLVRGRWLHATRVSAENFVPSRNQLPEHPLEIGDVQALSLIHI